MQVPPVKAALDKLGFVSFFPRRNRVVVQPQVLLDAIGKVIRQGEPLPRMPGAYFDRVRRYQSTG